MEEPLLRFTAASAEASAVIETARALLAQLTDGLTGSARLYLTELAETEEETVCTFDYAPAELHARYAADLPDARGAGRGDRPGGKLAADTL